MTTMAIMPTMLIMLIKNGNPENVEDDDTYANADTNDIHDDNDDAAAVMLIMTMPMMRCQ